MTRLGRLAVYMGWIEDPEELAEGRSRSRTPPSRRSPACGTAC